MRIDPKHFNKFIAFCAVITLIVIIYSTFHYSIKQTSDFQSRVDNVDFKNLSFFSYSDGDSLKINDLKGTPVVIHFWSTWSGKSLNVNQYLLDYSTQHDELKVIAASVKDAESLIMEYLDSKRYSFHFVEGTEFYQSLLVPGVPTQILLNRDGSLHSTHVGDDIEELQELLNMLL
tara:strand:+ start:40857 stop:41381 length:525 start_codon:yes stop_codon:yes gene_type:complete